MADGAAAADPLYAPAPTGGGGGGAPHLIVTFGVLAVTVAMNVGLPGQERMQARMQERMPWLDSELAKMRKKVDDQRDLLAVALVLVLVLVHLSSEQGISGAYRYLKEWWVMKHYGNFFLGFYAHYVSRTARGLVKKAGARATFERFGFENRVNISLNSLPRGSGGDLGTLQLRTLNELSLDKVLPDEGARQVYKHALQWTDTRSGEDGGDDGKAEFDPFISLSRSGRRGKIPEPQGDKDGGYEKGQRAREHHGHIIDQLTNLISAPYAIGHIGKDMGLQYSTREYVWGVTYERRDADGNEVPDVSLKARILLIQKDVLDRIEDGRIEPDASEDDDSSRDRRDRWQRLKTLRALWEADQKASPKEKRCFLVGKTSITVAKPGGETAGTTIPWDDVLSGGGGGGADVLAHPRVSALRQTQSRGELSKSDSPRRTHSAGGSVAVSWISQCGRGLSSLTTKFMKLAMPFCRNIYGYMVKRPKRTLLALGFLVFVFDLWDTVSWFLGTRFGQITIGAFAKDIYFALLKFLRRGIDQDQFGKRGFANRLNISLNSFILDDTATNAAAGAESGAGAPNTSMELRTMAEMGIDEVLPDEGARQVFRHALDWTDRKDETTGEKMGISPFITLSERVAKLGKDDPDPVSAVDEEEDAEHVKKMWRMTCTQIDNQISSPFATGHVGEDMHQNYSTASYVWGMAYERPAEDKSRKINQKVRVLLIRKSTLAQINKCTNDEELQSFERRMVRESSNRGYDAYRKHRLGQLRDLAHLYFTNTYKDRCYLVGEVSLTVPSPGAGREGVSFLERYTISPDRILHQTATSIVVAGTDKRSDHAPVALKFMRSKADYVAEVTAHARSSDKESKEHIVPLVETGRTSGGKITQDDIQAAPGSKLDVLCQEKKLLGTYLVILERGTVDLAHEISRNVHIDHKELVKIAKDVASALQYMNDSKQTAHGDVKLRNFVKTHTSDGKTKWKAIDLDGSCRHGDVIGAKLSTACCPPEMARLRFRKLYPDAAEGLELTGTQLPLTRASSSPVRQYQTQTASSAEADDSPGIVATAWPSMGAGATEDEPFASSLELPVGTDAATALRDSGHMYSPSGSDAQLRKFKSNSSHESADSLVQTVSYSNDIQDEDSSAARQRRWFEWLKQQNEVLADVNYDLWSFGVLLWTLFVPGATSMFLSSANDDMLSKDDLHSLAFEWEFRKLEMVDRVEVDLDVDPEVGQAARDLILWCLQSNPKRRPRNFGEVLQHPLFRVLEQAPSSDGRLRSRSISAAARVSSPAPATASELDAEPEPEPEPLVSFAHDARPAASLNEDDAGLVRCNTSAGSDSIPRPLHFTETVAERALRLHDAIEDGKTLVVKQLFNQGGVHVNLAMLPEDEACDDQQVHLEAHGDTRAVLPIHRAARLGHLEIVEFLCDEMSGMQLHLVLDRQIPRYQYTALHLAARYGHHHVVEFLISNECDTSVKSYRGKTAWDLAVENHCDEVEAVFQRWAAGGDDHDKHDALHKESESRYRRPKVETMFQEDLFLDQARCAFWELRRFDEWKELEADPASAPFSAVYRVPIFPTIQQRGRHFDTVSIKVAQDLSTQQRLVAEASNLAKLTHPNICHVLGLLEGSTPHSPDDTTWLFAWENCEMNLSSLLFDSKHDLHYSRPLMLELTKQIADAMAVIHDGDVLHLDLKPANVLLSKDANTQSPWVAKVANFGLAVCDAAEWIGSPLHMAPECTALLPTSVPDRPADVFSFAILTYEMFTHQRVQSCLGDLEFSQVWVGADGREDRTVASSTDPGMDGKWCEDMRAVATSYYEGNRPNVPTEFSKMLRLLVEACWEAEPADRPTFAELKMVLAEGSDETWLDATAGGDDTGSDTLREGRGKRDVLMEIVSNSAADRWKELSYTFVKAKRDLPPVNVVESDLKRTRTRLKELKRTSSSSITMRHSADLELQPTNKERDETVQLRKQLSKTQAELSELTASQTRSAHAVVARAVAAAGSIAVESVRRHELRMTTLNSASEGDDGRLAAAEEERTRAIAAALDERDLKQHAEATQITTQALALTQHAEQAKAEVEERNLQLQAELHETRARLLHEEAQRESSMHAEHSTDAAEPIEPTACVEQPEQPEQQTMPNPPSPRAVLNMDSLLNSHRALATPPSSTLTSVRDAFDPLAFLSASSDEEVGAEAEEAEVEAEADVELAETSSARPDVHEGVPPTSPSTVTAPPLQQQEQEQEIEQGKEQEGQPPPPSPPQGQQDSFKACIAILASALEADSLVLQGDGDVQEAFDLYTEGLRFADQALASGSYSPAVETILRKRAAVVEARLVDLESIRAIDLSAAGNPNGVERGQRPEYLQSEPPASGIMGEQNSDFEAAAPSVAPAEGQEGTRPTEPEPEEGALISSPCSEKKGEGIFARFDLDRDGFLNCSEYQAFAAQLGAEIDEADFVGLCEDCGADAGKGLSLLQFLQIYDDPEIPEADVDKDHALVFGHPAAGPSPLAPTMPPAPPTEHHPQPEPAQSQGGGTITVDFTQSGSLNLNLTPCDHGNGVMILAVPAGGQAATHPELRPGLIFSEVGGTSMRGLSYEAVVAAIQSHSARPLRVVFSETPWPPAVTAQAEPQPQPTPAQEVDPDPEQEVSVAFTDEGPLGLRFASNEDADYAVEILHVSADMQRQHRRLFPGLRLTRIAGDDVGGLGYTTVLQMLKRAGRPLRLSFRVEPEVEPEAEPEAGGAGQALEPQHLDQPELDLELELEPPVEPQPEPQPEPEPELKPTLSSLW